MEDENLEKDTPEVDSDQLEETTSEEETPEDDTSTNEDDSDEEKDWKAEAEKWKSTANNYKQEIEVKGLRKKELEKPVKTDSQYKTDYLSKRADVLDDFGSDLKDLSDSDFNKLKTILNPALESVYDTASKEERFVARGELKRTVSDLLNYVKGSKDREAELEKARLKGVEERDNMDSAEVRGKSKSAKSGGYNDEVRQLAKEKGWTLEETKVILDNRKKREKEYAPRYRI